MVFNLSTPSLEQVRLVLNMYRIFVQIGISLSTPTPYTWMIEDVARWDGDLSVEF
jgi:hypothetical protein